MNKWLILTAAHCFWNESPAKYLILPNVVNASSNQRPFESWPNKAFQIQDLVIHDAFNFETGLNDLAIVSLTHPIDEIDYETLSIAQNASDEKQRCFMAGLENPLFISFLKISAFNRIRNVDKD